MTIPYFFLLKSRKKFYVIFNLQLKKKGG